MAIGASLERVADELDAMKAQGCIEVWEREEGPAVILSAWFSKRLGYHLIEVGPQEVLRWAPLGDPIPPPPRAKYVCFDVRSAEMSAMLDLGPRPDVAASEAESCADEAEAWADAGSPTRDLPRPGRLLGSELTP